LKTGRDIAGLLIIEMDTPELAERNAKIMKNCPRIVTSGHSSNHAYELFIIPEEQKWWIEYPAEHPEVLKAKSVKLELIENLTYPEDFKLRVPDKRLEISPCGTNCLECPSRVKFNCKCCPATVHYKQ